MVSHPVRVGDIASRVMCGQSSSKGWGDVNKCLDKCFYDKSCSATACEETDLMLFK